MRARGRPVLGVLAGLLAGVSAALALVVFSVVALDSSLLVVVAAGGVVLGLLIGLVGPFGSRVSRSPRP